MSNSDPMTPRPHRLSGRLRPFVYAICAVAALVAGGLIWRVVHDRIQTGERERCRENLTRISEALRAYHDHYGMFPPAYVLGPSGKPEHSWRVLLLPFLGEQELFDQYQFDQPWDGPHNRLLADKMPGVYGCPGATHVRAGVPNYLAVVGRATVWPEQYSARLEDILDGPSGTIQLVESGGLHLQSWLEPQDIKASYALYRLYTGSGHEKKGEFPAVTVDGKTRIITQAVSRDNFRSLLSINGGRPLAGVDWPRDAAAAEVELPPPRPADELVRTDVYPYPTGPIAAGRNYVYCATFEIAWELARQEFGGDPLRLKGNPLLAAELNRHTFHRRNLSEDCYLARAGRGNADFRDQLRNEMSLKFPRSEPLLIDPDQQDHELEIYAYLLKTLPFSVSFDTLYKPLNFAEGKRRVEVVSFGVTVPRQDEARAEFMESQVTILDYVSDDDFVIRLTPANPRDEIVLAKVLPANTLEETITAVRARIANPNPRHTDKHFLSSEPLVIPKLMTSLDRRYNEIIGRTMEGTDLYVSQARQIIKFELSENGAVLESEALMLGDNGHIPETPAGKRKFIFDKPFLIYLIERDADQAYFAVWNENTELMTPLSR
ncbi:MAG: DUF1559 domain-containing protein [Planctomycetes bacterium]|nr:DUF1559 domain-containing protein [Planctomycetota bacterium]